MNDSPVCVMPEGEMLWDWWVYLAETPPASKDLIEVIPIGNDGVWRPGDAIIVCVRSVDDRVDPPTITATWN